MKHFDFKFCFAFPFLVGNFKYIQKCRGKYSDPSSVNNLALQLSTHGQLGFSLINPHLTRLLSHQSQKLYLFIYKYFSI